MSIITYAKRSISLLVGLDAELAEAAEAEGTTVSALLADAAAHALQIRRGLRAVEDWLREMGVRSPLARLPRSMLWSIWRGLALSPCWPRTRPDKG